MIAVIGALPPDASLAAFVRSAKTTTNALAFEALKDRDALGEAREVEKLDEDCEDEPTGDTLCVADTDCDGDRVWLVLLLRCFDGVSVAVAVVDGVLLLLWDCVVVSLDEPLSVPVWDGDWLGVCVILGVCEGVGERVCDLVPNWDGVGVNVRVWLEVGDGIWDPVPTWVGVDVGLRVAVFVCVTEVVWLREPVGICVSVSGDRVPVAVADCDGVWVDVRLCDAVGERVVLWVIVLVGVSLRVCVCERVVLGVIDAVRVCDEVPLVDGVGDLVRLCVRDCVCERLWVMEALSVWLWLGATGTTVTPRYALSGGAITSCADKGGRESTTAQQMRQAYRDTIAAKHLPTCVAMYGVTAGILKMAPYGKAAVLPTQ
jgi:hypothetical protein